MRLIRTDGATVWVQHAISLLRDEQGVPHSYVSQLVNVTEAREAREALHYMATHDSLTQMFNRRELLSRVAKILSHAPRAGARLAILFADLDGLKPVNDTFGHAAGDELIVEAAHRISGLLRDGDVASRVGGDEYVIALPGVQCEDDALAVAIKIRAAMAEPLSVGGVPVPVGISVGIALAQPGDDPASVVRRADAALYRAKKAGRNRIQVFDQTLDA
jgi:diguanylate cyclase (GGDEF)-like protein